MRICLETYVALRIINHRTASCHTDTHLQKSKWSQKQVQRERFRMEQIHKCKPVQVPCISLKTTEYSAMEVSQSKPGSLLKTLISAGSESELWECGALLNTRQFPSWRLTAAVNYFWTSQVPPCSRKRSPNGSNKQSVQVPKTEGALFCPLSFWAQASPLYPL